MVTLSRIAQQGIYFIKLPYSLFLVSLDAVGEKSQFSKLVAIFLSAYNRCGRNQEVAQSLIYSLSIIVTINANSSKKLSQNLSHNLASLANLFVEIELYERIKEVVTMYPNDTFLASSKVTNTRSYSLH